MGAKIEGAGSQTIKIKGVSVLKSSSHTIIPDRIEAATLLMAGAMTKGHLLVEKCRPDHLKQVLLKLKSAGLEIKTGSTWIESLPMKTSLKAVSLSTAPYPGFPTDLQAQFTALMTQAEGESRIEECIFENRFMHIPELLRLNAKITIHKQTAKIKGPEPLKAAAVTATDLRASSCLILAALSAQGLSQIRRVYHLDRGYEKLEEKLASIGADIRRKF